MFFSLNVKHISHVYPLTLVHSLISQKALDRNGRQFLDEEAELSEEGGSVSSDECDGEELDKSLDGFVVDASQCSQGLNGKGNMKDGKTHMTD